MRVLVSGTLTAVVMSLSVVSVGQAADQTSEVPSAPEQAVVTATAVPSVTPDEARAAVRGDEDAADLVAQLPASRTDRFGLVGVTWARGFDTTGMTVQVRLRTTGIWSSWEELEIESDEGAGGRDGTEPLWVGAADGIAVRVTSPTGERPAGLSTTLVDPGADVQNPRTGAEPAIYRSAEGGGVVQVADGSPTFTPRPTIISRATWGARKNTRCDAPLTGNETRGIVVHHTAGSNSYAKSTSKSIVRSIQAYHMKGRKWCDIGYNYLVDKYGQIFQGRNGSLDKPVRAAHSGDTTVNTYTMGVSMIGTFTKTEPYAAQKDSMVKLLGWRLATTFHPAKGTYDIGRFTLHRIAGHRNVYATACPGAKAYAWLSRSGGLRDRVAAYIADYRSPIKTLYTSLGAARTGPIYVGEYGSSTNRKARASRLDLYSKVGIGAFTTSGFVRQEFNAMGAQSGSLGYPASELAVTARADVQVQTFQYGRIYRVTRGAAVAGHAIWGAVAAAYVREGQADGPLGAPAGRLTKITDGRWRATFDHGYITREKDFSVTVTLG